MKFISWNVNGIRAVIKKGFAEFVEAEQPDILCLQETKASPEQVGMEWLDSAYHCHWNSAEKKGYSGVAVFSKVEPISVLHGMGVSEHDSEGRVLTLEYADFFLVNVYTPNSQDELRRLAYRQQWDAAFLGYLKGLEASKPVVFCGDLNVAHEEIDLARPKTNRYSPGFSDQERAGFGNLVKAGFVDTFREFEKGEGHYSWWSYRAGARKNNVGWRIDYWCVSESLREKVTAASILPYVMGSDHCPVVMEISASTGLPPGAL